MKLATIFLWATASLMAFTFADEPLPSDVRRLVNQREDAIAKIDKTYLQELEKLKLKYAKLGDLDTANRVASLIKTVSEMAGSRKGNLFLPKTEQELRVFLTGTKWKLPESNTASFEKDGVIKTNNSKATYVVTGRRKITMTWGGKNVIRCELNEDCTRIKELNGWRKSTWQIKR